MYGWRFASFWQRFSFCQLAMGPFEWCITSTLKNGFSAGHISVMQKYSSLYLPPLTRFIVLKWSLQIDKHTYIFECWIKCKYDIAHTYNNMYIHIIICTLMIENRIDKIVWTVKYMWSLWCDGRTNETGMNLWAFNERIQW